MKHKKDGADDADKPCKVVPLELLSEIDDGERREDHERNHFLNRLELSRGEVFVSPPIGGHLKAVLDESYQPADDDYLNQGRLFEL